MSWRAQVIADSSDKWVGNGLTFATKDEAAAYVHDLMWRWTSVRETRVLQSDEPVSHRWTGDKTEAV